ncbi:P-loop NTPase family protein [Riemerella anatipestifer]|uniref:SF4 helicase domain-containing protein n=1 Tax=Riemerella anatipestifer (strain ATCC 11845 / DSM 15868 / JCM 9532 / NCTC 11014) TaxID=693978 RepID=E4TEB6_RIEAD|nr:hypothetical protein [Riemerella anatipestifer]ADQ83125.1 hypothetical protein Riean_1972 [Riemerella anatipestifer ATCC 11845 = DSM 15868]AFD55185.1 hypothetical protein RA0C_0171 [Riemerella anatipestifer ATCC 11845 = DSM 15868]MRM93178.1 hypothetical protein [Riemerella anatipestifer]SNV79660.1 Uncharacterised protein [Riemerella anatipestifer]
MAFIDLASVHSKMRKLRTKGEIDPVYFSFETWNDFNNGKWLMGSRKCTLLIGGEPNHGKSQVTNEMVMQLIEKHHFKVALFTTESGDVEKVFTQFCGMYQGKPYTKVRPDGKPNKYAMTDEEVAEAEDFILRHLYIFKQDRKDTSYQKLDNIYKELAMAEANYGIKFDCLVIDPIYDIDDFEPKAGEVLRVLNRINLEAEENNRFDIIVNHVAETAKVTTKSGKRIKLTALADEFYGGKNNNRKAMLQILVHRPEPNENPEGDEEYVAENQTNIHILKIKPEGVAKWGIYSIYYDWRSRRYYEMFDDKVQFAQCTKFKDRRPNQEFKIEEFRTTPSEAFNTINYETDEMPF